MQKLSIALFILFIWGCKTKIIKEPLNFEGKIVAIKDGDTFEVLKEGKAITLRLEHIDCPEKKQPFGKNAKQFASDLCFGKIVQVIGTGKTDRYKRYIVELFIDSICINKELVKNGLAWHYKKYSHDSIYNQLEIEARNAKKGLWVDEAPISPWLWRK
jgi:endonuclease YncB( thermonuclease family)